MDNTFDVRIKFIDGEQLDIPGATEYGLNSTPNPKVVYVELSNNRLFFNFSTVKYIFKINKQKQEE